MKILTGSQISETDRYTIRHRPVKSVDLMEEASVSLVSAFLREVASENSRTRIWIVFAGKGNNGGDGLAVARLLYENGENVQVVSVYPPDRMTEETAFNLERLPAPIPVAQASEADLEDLISRMQKKYGEVILVDALLGSGVHGSVKEPLASLIRTLNASDARIWSIDLPSGLPTEPSGFEGTDPAQVTVIRAERTFTIARPKLSMLFPETGGCSGKITVVPLDLDASFVARSPSPYEWTDEAVVRELQKRHPRTEFLHKGNAGHALLVCGSVGMTGAAVLATGGALRSGCGLVTLHLPGKERSVIHQTHPAAIVSCDPGDRFSQLPEHLEKYSAVGIGCGMRQEESIVPLLRSIMSEGKPMVLDADALNLMSRHPDLLDAVPAGSVLTPHIGELRRLVGDWSGPEEKMSLVKALSARTRSCVVVKGAHTMVVTPDGRFRFNGSGNPGMAKGGSGDVLAGLITGLLAYGYPAEDAAVLGVWRHGRAGDAAARRKGEEAVNSEDLYDFL